MGLNDVVTPIFGGYFGNSLKNKRTMGLSGIVLLFVFQSWPLRMHIIAGSAGVVTAFSVMGVFSVGLFYAPLALLLLLGALASWRASHKPIIMLLGAYILFALVQTFGMLILASL